MEELREILVRIEERQIGIKDDVSELKNKVAIQNGRIVDLEKWKAWMLGAIAVIGALFGISKH